MTETGEAPQNHWQKSLGECYELESHRPIHESTAFLNSFAKLIPTLQDGVN